VLYTYINIHMKNSASLVRLMLVASVFLSFAGYNFISAANWTAPTGAPPTNNVDVPLNEGPDTQDKTGILNLADITTGNVAVFGNQSATGYIMASSSTNSVKITPNNITITSSGPQIQFVDTDAGTLLSRLLYSTNQLIVQGDRNGDGSYDSPNPLVVHIGATTSQDYATFANQVRAPYYCDQGGHNCFSPGTTDTGIVANIRGKEYATSYVQAGFIANTGAYQQFVSFPIAYQTNTVPVVTLNGNYVGGYAGYACNINNTGFYICGETTPPTGSSGWSPDGSKGHYWNAIGVRNDAANDPSGGSGPTGTWYQANAPLNNSSFTCSSFCTGKGKKSVPDPATGGLCLSGENRPSATPPGISYTFGTWGGTSGAGDFNAYGWSSGSNYTMCYNSGQKQDDNTTDINVACYCQ
jgi:hypothetical protein